MKFVRYICIRQNTLKLEQKKPTKYIVNFRYISEVLNFRYISQVEDETRRDGSNPAPATCHLTVVVQAPPQ